MQYVFGLLTILASALLVLLVVIQNSKGGGLNSAFGTSNLTAMIGTRRASQDIEKFTWYIAAVLLVLCLVSSAFVGPGEKPEEPKFGNMMSAPVQNAQPAAQPQSTPMPNEQ